MKKRMRGMENLSKDGRGHGMDKNPSEGIGVVEMKTEPTELYKILKFESLVQSGGEAKVVISERLVRVNGDVETRKRRKIMSGDIIEFGGKIIRVVLKR